MPKTKMKLIGTGLKSHLRRTLRGIIYPFRFCLAAVQVLARSCSRKGLGTVSVTVPVPIKSLQLPAENIALLVLAMVNIADVKSHP